MEHRFEAPSIVEDFHALTSIARRPVRSADDLSRNLSEIHRAIVSVDLDRYDSAEIAKWAPSIMRGLFELRIAIKSAIPEWNRQGLVSPAVQRALRDTFRVCRSAADMLGEIVIGFERLASGKETLPAFTGTRHNTFVNPDYYDGHDIPFRSGDVLLVRGTAHNSAAIARIGDVDTQFSHVGIIHVDNDGKALMVEALIEYGASITPVEQVLSYNVGRAVLYRHRDPALAHEAARFIHAKVKKSLGRLRKPILYDFSMRLDGYKELYCSKLIRHAFQKASKGSIVLPTFLTRLDMTNRDFFERVGVTATETFAPGDIDIEPQFDLVAEWQDYRMTSSLRMQDLLMDKIFEWMEIHGWKFEEDVVIRLVSVLGKASSYLSGDAKNLLKSVMPTVPVNMSRRTVAVIAMLHQTGQELLTHLEALEANTVRMKGRPAHPREVRAHLDQLRENAGGRIGYLVAPE